MMAWERDLMESAVQSLDITPDCSVLEIGFGLGYSANAIQAKHPRSHTIIECAPAVLQRMDGWAANKKGVKVVAGYWQNELASLKTFDAIFFDDFPLPHR
ncbi:unnamed protein product [Chrysoparadoxa australica]